MMDLAVHMLHTLKTNMTLEKSPFWVGNTTSSFMVDFPVVMLIFRGIFSFQSVHFFLFLAAPPSTMKIDPRKKGRKSASLGTYFSHSLLPSFINLTTSWRQGCKVSAPKNLPRMGKFVHGETWNPYFCHIISKWPISNQINGWFFKKQIHLNFQDSSSYLAKGGRKKKKKQMETHLNQPTNPPSGFQVLFVAETVSEKTY